MKILFDKASIEACIHAQVKKIEDVVSKHAEKIKAAVSKLKLNSPKLAVIHKINKRVFSYVNAEMSLVLKSVKNDPSRLKAVEDLKKTEAIANQTFLNAASKIETRFKNFFRV